MDRHCNRALLMRQWLEEAKEKERQRRLKERADAERRMRRCQAQFEAIKTERELDTRTCNFCQLVRAEAFGLGHSNWKERQCSRCWSAHATLRSHMRHSEPNPHATFRPDWSSDGDCPPESSSSQAHRTGRGYRSTLQGAYSLAACTPHHAGLAVAGGRIAEGLALLGIPLVPADSLLAPAGKNSEMHGGSCYVGLTQNSRSGMQGRQGMSRSSSYAPSWGKLGAASRGPWEWQEERFKELHDLKNELLLQRGLEQSMHLVSRSVRLSPQQLGRPPVRPVGSQQPAFQAAASQGCSNVRSSNSNDKGVDSERGGGTGVHSNRWVRKRAGEVEGGSAGNEDGRSSSSRESVRGGSRASLDQEALLAAVRKQDAGKLLEMLGPSVLEKLLEGCTGIPAQAAASPPQAQKQLAYPGAAPYGPDQAAAAGRKADPGSGSSAPSDQEGCNDRSQVEEHAAEAHAYLQRQPQTQAEWELQQQQQQQQQPDGWSPDHKKGNEWYQPHQQRLEQRAHHAHQQQYSSGQLVQHALQGHSRHHPMYQHNCDQHAANMAQLEWASSLRVPGPEGYEGQQHDHAYSPLMRRSVRKAAATAHKEQIKEEARYPREGLGVLGLWGVGPVSTEDVGHGKGHSGLTKVGGEGDLGRGDQGEQREGELGVSLERRGAAGCFGAGGQEGGRAEQEVSPGEGAMQREEVALNSRALCNIGVTPGEQRRRDWDMKHEREMRKELEQAERDLVTAPTQKGRIAALFIASTLREELGRLARHNRCYKRVIETCKHAVRVDTRDPVHGIKGVLGRNYPPETALPVAYDSYGRPRYQSDVREGIGADKNRVKQRCTGERGLAHAVVGGNGIAAGHGAINGAFPDDGIVGVFRLQPVLCLHKPSQHGQEKRLGTPKQEAAGPDSNDSDVGDAERTSDALSPQHPRAKSNSPPSAGHHQQDLGKGDGSKCITHWGPGHPHTNHPRPYHSHPHLIQDPCYNTHTTLSPHSKHLPHSVSLCLSPDPHYIPIQASSHRHCSFDPHHNLTHYQTYAQYHRSPRKAHPAAAKPQGHHFLGTNYPEADAYSFSGPLNRQPKSRADAAAEAAVARLRDPYGYGIPNQLRDLAWQETHPATADPLKVADEVPWKPHRMSAPISQAPGSWEDVDHEATRTSLFGAGPLSSGRPNVMAKKDQAWADEVTEWLCKSRRERVQESKQLRAMPVSDYKLQQQKERDWKRALQEVQHLLWVGTERLEDAEGG